MSVIQYVKDDWTIVLPYRLLHNRYRGASRSSYALICLVYYSIKSLLILYFYGAFKVYKFILWDIWEWLWRRSKKHEENNDSSKDQDVTIESNDEQEEIVEELPFCQIFRLNQAEDLHIIRVEYCPDETAFIRIVGEDSYTKPYKRKVQRDEAGNRFIEFNDKKYYLECSGKNETIDIDKMDGGTFEHFCADLLRVNGWTDVQVTPGSGDHGIDITAEKDDIKWGFQCKRWGDTKVDAIAIGQTYKGKALYECDMVAVITTSTLTAQAEGEAKQLGIKVWGRGKIRQLMRKLDNADDYYLSA